MGNALLYSTNVFLKFQIQEQFCGEIHYVWCSENYDSKTLSVYSVGALVGASSNPADIYRELKRDVDSKDKHSRKINAQKLTLNSLAVEWEIAGKISPTQKESILYLVKSADFSYWRPLLYVIPRTTEIEARLQEVEISRRAGIGPEFIIEDLKRSEFEIVEL